MLIIASVGLLAGCEEPLPPPVEQAPVVAPVVKKPVAAAPVAAPVVKKKPKTVDIDFGNDGGGGGSGGGGWSG
ncbi:MAG: hypothetical protein J0L76_06490 [Rhodobacterales bacterium]|nr:hypothetical protein [Rhodobacterales bacterium]